MYLNPERRKYKKNFFEEVENRLVTKMYNVHVEKENSKPKSIKRRINKRSFVKWAKKKEKNPTTCLDAHKYTADSSILNRVWECSLRSHRSCDEKVRRKIFPLFQLNDLIVRWKMILFIIEKQFFMLHLEMDSKEVRWNLNCWTECCVRDIKIVR